MRAAKFDPVAKKMHLLNQQLETLQVHTSRECVNSQNVNFVIVDVLRVDV